jgi:hypothetical protein
MISCRIHTSLPLEHADHGAFKDSFETTAANGIGGQVLCSIHGNLTLASEESRNDFPHAARAALASPHAIGQATPQRGEVAQLFSRPALLLGTL